MEEETKCGLRQISSRITVEDYARVVKMVENSRGEFKDISDFVRKRIHDNVAGVILGSEDETLVRAVAEKMIKEKKSKKSKRGFFKRFFGL